VKWYQIQTQTPLYFAWSSELEEVERGKQVTKAASAKILCAVVVCVEPGLP